MAAIRPAPHTGSHSRSSMESEAPDGWQRRLQEEFDDDRIDLPGDAAFRELVLEELDHCRRVPVFEGRRATYGAIIVPTRVSDAFSSVSMRRFGFDIVPLDAALSSSRMYADGRSTYLVRDLHGGMALACFDRAMLFEADLVDLQEATAATIIQRTPVLDVVRLAVDGQMISWDGRNWNARPSATALRTAMAQTGSDDDARLGDIIELAVHWLAPGRIGATIVVDPGASESGALDVSTAAHTPALSVSDRRHFAALAAVLARHDLAVIVDADGVVRKVAVGLRWSPEAEQTIHSDRGMRHRSAQRYSFDRPAAIVVVVSEDGPVTVYRAGEVVVTTGSGT